MNMPIRESKPTPSAAIPDPADGAPEVTTDEAHETDAVTPPPSDRAGRLARENAAQQRYLQLVDAPAGRVTEAARSVAGLEAERDVSSSCSHRIQLGSEQEARVVFGRATDALLDVDHWGDRLGVASADFDLRGPDGSQVEGRRAQLGDFIRIDLPGPAPMAWVRIEAVSVDPDRVSLRVRPSHDPTAPATDRAQTQHFFTSEATNTFTLTRHGDRVRLAVEGRNESPNVGRESRGPVDPLMNRATFEGARADFQHRQWDALTRKLLEESR